MTKIGDAYRWMHGRVAVRPTNFSWVIEGKLAGSGLPVTHGEFDWALAQGIRSILTVREAPLPPEWLNNGEGVGYLHLEVEDFDAPSPEQLDAAVQYISEQISRGRPVMVHCAAGKGRTGAVLASYLLKEQNLTADQAIERIRSMRPGSVQSEMQETAVSMYERYLKSK